VIAISQKGLGEVNWMLIGKKAAGWQLATENSIDPATGLITNP
jgi:hypothetical protein